MVVETSVVVVSTAPSSTVVKGLTVVISGTVLLVG